MKSFVLALTVLVSLALAAAEPMRVQVEAITAQPTALSTVAFGELEASRSVTIATQTAGTVSKLLVSEGQVVKAGDLLVSLANNDRAARLTQANVALSSARADYQRAAALVERQLQPRALLDNALSAVRAAEAARDSAQVEQDRADIRAPFAGRVEGLTIEQGSALGNNTAIMSLVDQAGFKAVVDVPQQAVFDLTVGTEVSVMVAGVRQYSGVLALIGQRANPQTRTFDVEVAIQGDLNGLREGMTARVDIPTGQATTHFVSPASLFLDSAGQLGLKAVDGNNRVTFYPVEVVKAEGQGVYVAGAPAALDLITVGGGFVATGVEVVPVSDAL